MCIQHAKHFKVVYKLIKEGNIIKLDDCLKLKNRVVHLTKFVLIKNQHFKFALIEHNFQCTSNEFCWHIFYFNPHNEI